MFDTVRSPEAEFQRWKVTALRAEAAAQGISSPASHSKADLVSLLSPSSARVKTSSLSGHFENWLVTELRAELRARGLQPELTRPAMIEQLRRAVDASQAGSPSSSSSAAPDLTATGSEDTASAVSDSSVARASLSASADDSETTTSPTTPCEDATPVTTPASASSSSSSSSSTATPTKGSKVLRGILSPSKMARKFLSPNKVTGLPVGKRKRGAGVKFQSVEVREYKRRHAGGGGVPHSGAYPLGIDWSHERQFSRKISEYELQRQTEGRAYRDNMPALSEQERKAVLEVSDPRPPVERTSSFINQRKELTKLRRARSDIGCDCAIDRKTGRRLCGTGSGDNGCPCFADQLECCYETCGCDLRYCTNPFKDC